MQRSTLAFLLSCLLAPASASLAQSPRAPIDAEQAHGAATRRAALLTRGVNLSGWFASWGDYSPQHTSTYITAADFAAMHAMGIRYVRFPLDPVLLTRRGPNSDQAELWKRIDAALDLALDAGLTVDFCVFPNSDYKQQLATQAGVDRFLMVWQTLARHLVTRDPERLVFELMNESETSDPFRWVGIQSAAIHAIRQIAPQHTILASGAHFDSIPDILDTQLQPDPNVIYTFHFYEPYPFTHQGAPWGSIEWNFYKNIPYPATPEQIAPILASVPGDMARYQLYLYGQAGWNAKAISGRLAFVATWARDRGVPVICNEFGAFRDTAPPAARTQYLHDVRSALEEQGIGWGMWDWSGNFGLVTRPGGVVAPDPKNVEALGLKLP